MHSTIHTPAQEAIRGHLEQELLGLAAWVRRTYAHDSGLELLSVCLISLADEARHLEAIATPASEPAPVRRLTAGVEPDGAPYIQYFDPDC